MPVFVLRPAVGAPAKALPCGLVFLHRGIAGSILDDVLVYLVVRAQGGVQVEHGTGRGVVGAAVVEVHLHLLGIAGGTVFVWSHRGCHHADDHVAHYLHFQRRGIRVGRAFLHIHRQRLQRVRFIKAHHGLYQDAVGVHHGILEERVIVVVHGGGSDIVHHHHRRGVAIQQTGNVVLDVLRLHAATAQPDFHFMHTRLFHGREVLGGKLVAERCPRVVLCRTEHAGEFPVAHLHVQRLLQVARELYAGEHVCLVLLPRRLPLVHHAQRQVGQRAAQRGSLRLLAAVAGHGETNAVGTRGKELADVHRGHAALLQCSGSTINVARAVVDAHQVGVALRIGTRCFAQCACRSLSRERDEGMGIAGEGGEDGQRAVFQRNGNVVHRASQLQTLYRVGVAFLMVEVNGAVGEGCIAEHAAHVEHAAQRAALPLLLACSFREHHVGAGIVVHLVIHILQLAQRAGAHAFLQLLLDGADAPEGGRHVISAGAAGNGIFKVFDNDIDTT